MMTLKKVSFVHAALEFSFELVNPKYLNMPGETQYFWKFEALEKDGVEVEGAYYATKDPSFKKYVDFALHLYNWSKEHLFKDVNKLEKALNEEVEKWKF